MRSLDVLDFVLPAVAEVLAVDLAVKRRENRCSTIPLFGNVSVRACFLV